MALNDSPFIIWLNVWVAKIKWIFCSHWLSEWARWAHLAVGSEKNGSLFGNINNKCFIDQVCLVKMAGYRPASFFLAFLLILHLSGSINIQKRAWLILCYLELTLGLSKTNLYRHKTSWYRVTFEGQGNLPAAQVKTSNTCLLLQDLQWKWIIDKYLHDLIKS